MCQIKSFLTGSVRLEPGCDGSQARNALCWNLRGDVTKALRGSTWACLSVGGGHWERCGLISHLTAFFLFFLKASFRHKADFSQLKISCPVKRLNKSVLVRAENRNAWAS